MEDGRGEERLDIKREVKRINSVRDLDAYRLALMLQWKYSKFQRTFHSKRKIFTYRSST